MTEPKYKQTRFGPVKILTPEEEKIQKLESDNISLYLRLDTVSRSEYRLKEINKHLSKVVAATIEHLEEIINTPTTFVPYNDPAYNKCAQDTLGLLEKLDEDCPRFPE